MLVVDNINFRFNASEEVSQNRSKIVNATIGIALPTRIPNPFPPTPENLAPQGLPTALPSGFYLQTAAEHAACVQTLTLLIGRVLADFFPTLQMLKPVINKALTHAQSEHTSKATEQQGTEILFLDENKSSDVPHILDYLTVRSSFSPNFLNQTHFYPSIF